MLAKQGPRSTPSRSYTLTLIFRPKRPRPWPSQIQQLLIGYVGFFASMERSKPIILVDYGQCGFRKAEREADTLEGHTIVTFNSKDEENQEITPVWTNMAILTREPGSSAHVNHYSSPTILLPKLLHISIVARWWQVMSSAS
ncbi:hypothetical protein D9758_013153 [Tetrapyrgos nigripes]|uniref:Uncharacterized protein n=1 Tax=Tetrapyrgos nigripes TaxID=182062 RepID=A0A8H5FKG4_9AGAR|nr:hypothetical protein D9758_013153 [Tetrapyrgos nigripes]